MRLAAGLLALFLPVHAADLTSEPAVRKALDYLQANNARHLELQRRICEIPAPTFHEAARAKFMEGEFRRAGLKNVEIDAQGNVLGWRPGQTDKAMVIAAHLDISFSPGVNTKIREEGSRWWAPGISDDSRGLAAMMAIVEALDHGKISTRRTLLFVANVGEEGLGDLAGIKYLFQKSPHRSRLEAFISIDGVSPSSITNGGVGVRRYLISVKGPGGHSYGNFGRPNAIHTIGRIVTKLATLDVPSKPKTTYNVGKITGGTTINAIAEEASMEVDLRSEGPAELDRIELKLLEFMREGVAEENKQREGSNAAVTAEAKIIGSRPSGQTPAESPLTQSAMSAVKLLGLEPTLHYSSTDSNLPISLGIPALTLGGGGRGGNAHSLQEWYEPVEPWLGPQMVMLTVLGFDRL